MIPESDGSAAEPRSPSASMWKGNSSRSLKQSDFRVQPEKRPGWVRGSDRVLVVGERVFCAGGEGIVLSLHGRTGDGSRLLQIQLGGGKAPPFFAAASNVLVGPC